LTKFRRFDGSVKCGRDIQEVWMNIHDDYKYTNLSYEGDWNFSNPMIGNFHILDNVSIRKVSKNPWSYIVYENQNCEGKFNSQYSTIDRS